MRVLMVLEHDLEHPLLDRRVHKEAKALIEDGHDIHLITWATRQKKGKRPAKYDKDGIKVVRLFQDVAAAEKGILSKLRPFWSLSKRTIRIAKKLRPDVIHCHDVIPLPAARIAARKTGAKLVYDAHELHTGTAEPKNIRRAYGITEKIIIPTCSLVITANEIRRKRMAKRYNMKKSMAVNNYPLLEEKRPRPVKNKKIRFLYQGGISQNRGINNILEALKDVKGDYEFYFYGFGSDMERYEQLVKEYGLQKKAYFKGTLKIEELFKVMRKMDVGVLSLLNSSKNNYYCAPNKLYDYMKAGNAVLGPTFPHMIKEIEQGGIGKCCDFDDVKSVKRAVEWFIKHQDGIKAMKRKSYDLHKERYHWEREVKRLQAAYRKL